MSAEAYVKAGTLRDGTSMQANWPKTRAECIAIIDKHGKRALFENPPEDRTLEQYFSEYAHKEPDVWIWVLNDLQIKL